MSILVVPSPLPLFWSVQLNDAGRLVQGLFILLLVVGFVVLFDAPDHLSQLFGEPLAVWLGERAEECATELLKK